MRSVFYREKGPVNKLNVDTMNITMANVTESRNTFLAHVLATSCSMDKSVVEVDNFFSLPEFLFSACLFVTVATAGPVLLGLLVHVKRLALWLLSRMCPKCRCQRKHAVAPKPPTSDLETGVRSEDEDDDGGGVVRGGVEEGSRRKRGREGAWQRAGGVRVGWIPHPLLRFVCFLPNLVLQPGANCTDLLVIV